MVSGRTVAALLLCSLTLGASWEAGEAAALRPARQLLQSSFFEPGVSGGGGGWGGGRRRGGSGAASATCQGDAAGLLPDAQTEIQQAVAKAFQQCTLVPCRPEASGVAPVIAEAVAPILVAAANDAFYSTACSDEPDSVASQLASTYQQAVGGVGCGSDADSDAASSMADLLSTASQVAGESLFAYCDDLECAASDLADSLEDPIAQNLADALDACLEAGQAQAPAPEPEQATAPAPEAEQAAVPPPAPEAPAPAPMAELPLPGPFGVVALPTPGGLPPAPEMPAVDATSMPAPSFGLQPSPAPAPEPEVASFAPIPAPEPIIAPAGPAGAATNATNTNRAAAAGPIADVLQQRLAIGNP